MSSTHFSFNLPVNIILERSVSKLYLMVGVHFCATSFQLFTTSSSAVGAPPAENTLGHYKWRRPSSKIRDFCELDIFSTALLLCSKLQLESLFGRRPLDREGDDFCPYLPSPPTLDCKSNFIPSRSNVQHFYSLLQEHHLGPGLVLGHLPEDRRLGDEHERGDQGDRCLPHQDRDQAQGHGGEDEDLVQRPLGLLGPALGREDGGVEKGLSGFFSPMTSDMTTNDGSFRLRATLTKSTARSTRSCGRN